MFKLSKYIKNYKLQAVLGPVFKLIETVFELLVPLVVAKIIDKGILGQDRKYIFSMCCVLFFFALMGLICALTAQYFAAKTAVGVSTELRRDLFKKINGLSYRQLDELGAATLITRMTGDINQIQTGINLVLRLLLRSPFVVFGAVIMAFTVDSAAALVFVVAVPVLFAAVFSIILVCIPLYGKVQEKLDGVLSKTRENLQGTRVIRAFCREDEEISEFGEKNGALAKMQIFVGKISSFLNPLTLVIINISVAVLICVGGERVSFGRLTGGGVAALYNYMSQILVELIKLANLLVTLTKSIAASKRVGAVLDIKSDFSCGNQKMFKESDTAVEFRDVSMSYGDKNNALSNINLKIGKGELFGIIGSTGSGKSTAVNLLPRFYDANSGEILINGTNIKEYDIEFLRKNIGVVEQKTVLFNGTVRDNIKMGLLNCTDEEIWQVLKTAQAEQMIKEKPGELDFLIEQEGKNLSGGQRQRLAIARALIKKPEILILDDSLSALDFATAARLLSALKKSDYVKTVIFVSQRVTAVSNADNIAVFDEGRVLSVGSHNYLRENCQVYKEICDLQL